MRQPLKSFARISLFFFMGFGTTEAGAQPSVQQTDTVFTLVVKLHRANQKITVKKAALEYNKNFAYSLTFDDGLISAYRVAFPLMNGGYISKKYIDEWKNDQGGDGTTSPGLFYTDGCGHQIPFRAAIAINAKSIENDSVTNRGRLSWNEVSELAKAGWSIMNHSYAHATGRGTDFYRQITDNNEAVLSKLGIHMHQFVVPGGDGEKGYEKLYSAAAFNAGMDAVAAGDGAGPAICVDGPLYLNKLIYKRVYSTSNENIKELFKTKTNILNSISEVAGYSQTGKKYWLNEFTHSAGNDNLWGISLKYETLSYYLKMIELKYGVKGKDEVWVAPFEEVYDYLKLRDATALTVTRKGKFVYCTIRLPKKLMKQQYRVLSLTIYGAKGFKPEKQVNPQMLTFNNSINGLVNLYF